MVSPMPFNTVDRAALSSQASSGPAGRCPATWAHERVIKYVGSDRNDARLCINELKNSTTLQNVLMHPKGRAFYRLVDKVVCEIVRQESSTEGD